MPYTLTTDVRFNKTFRTSVGDLGVFLEVYNLFNRRNALSVNNWTGQPFTYGDVRAGENVIESWRQSYAIMSPGWYGPPRQILLGLRYTFRGE
jgi:outer membrane receptor protein involved in Fe transport